MGDSFIILIAIFPIEQVNLLSTSVILCKTVLFYVNDMKVTVYYHIFKKQNV